VRFAAMVAKHRGHITDSDFAAVKRAGYGDAQPIEIVRHDAPNGWTGCFNEVLRTGIDFPVASARKAA
jgi:alkylhydroperoxidase family enzyme